MDYKFKLFLYYLNWIALLFALGGTVYSAIMTLTGNLERHKGVK